MIKGIFAIMFFLSMQGHAKETRMQSIYDFEVTTIDGTKATLEPYRGKVMLIINVASRCGFTPQYEGLEALYKKYKERGFVVLAFPCNQFASQESGSEEEILSFCQTNYGVTFPIFSKIEVNGKNAHPLYLFLKKQRSGIFGTEAIKWNFTKFLIDKEGNVIERFAPSTSPSSIEPEIEELLR